MVSLLDPEVVVDESNFQFEVERGSCYLWCWFGLLTSGLSLPCYCIARKFMQSQEIHFVNNKLNYRSDSWFLRTDKMVPLDRIQDVNIMENCCHRCFGVASISVQTAGGGELPEIVIVAPKNPKLVRDAILAKRDAVAHLSNGTDGMRKMSRADMSSSAEDMKQLNDTLLRIEQLLQKGAAEVSKTEPSI